MNLLETPGDRLLAAIRSLLTEKGITTEDEIAAAVERTDRASPARGAAMVARAWTDPEFRALMLEDGTRAVEAMGIPMRGLPPLGVLENTADTHNLVVCTLCSCYPRAVLGYPPFWFKSPPTAPAPSATRRACWPSGARCSRKACASAWWTARRTTVGWCCRAARPEPRAGTRQGSLRSCARAI